MAKEDYFKYIQTIFIVLLWLAYLGSPVIVFPGSVSWFFNDLTQLLRNLIINCFSIALYYLNYYYAIPKYIIKKNFFAYGVFHILFGLMTTLAVMAFEYIVNYEFDSTIKFTFFLYVFRGLFVLIASFTVYYYKRYKLVEITKKDMELKALKAQINPHFLFNTLNTIYSQALNKSDKTAESIARLSTLMRYNVTKSEKDMVTLDEELEYLRNYIDLQRLRLTDKTEVSFLITGKIFGWEIPPLIFINFIENAFKYGVSTEIQTNIYIKIDISRDSLLFYVKNLKIKKDSVSLESSEVGLKNIRSRLDLLYGDKYSLEIRNENLYYQVKLEIKR